MTDHGSSQSDRDPSGLMHPPIGLMHPPISIGDLAKQLNALRAEVAALKADFGAAKQEGAEQVDDLRDRISDTREYTENLNQRRVENIDDLTGAMVRFKDDLWALQVSLERKIGDVERQSRRV